MEFLTISGGISLLIGAVAMLIRALGHQAPGIVDAFRRWTEALRDSARSKRITEEQLASVSRTLMARIDRLERTVSDYLDRISALEDLVATQAETIAALRAQLDERERRLAAATAEREELARSIAAGGGAEAKALPKAHRPALGRDDTGSFKVPK
jgi:septal ring factor EnvC (AmiA/AmiB activator)